MRCKFLFVTALVLVGSALGRTARADDPRPNAALAACASGDVARGVAILGELYAETRSPSFVFNQGRCYQKNGQIEQARYRFAEYLRIGTKEPAEDLQRAQAFVKEIDETLARQRAAAPAPLVAAPVAPAPVGEHPRALRIASIVCAGVGVAAVGAGVYMSFKVGSINDDIQSRFGKQDYVTDGAELQRQQSNGARYQTWQWVGYGVGAAALAASVTTFILGGASWSGTGSSERAALNVTPAVSPAGAGGVVRWRF